MHLLLDLRHHGELLLERHVVVAVDVALVALDLVGVHLPHHLQLLVQLLLLELLPLQLLLVELLDSLGVHVRLNLVVLLEALIELGQLAALGQDGVDLV